MDEFPNPLTPVDAELRNFREMPIDVPRLLGSDLVHDESPEACWSAMLLWCVSWHEVPAGSLPDNDEWLAKRAGYWHKGKLDPTWHDVRDGALHGWIKCSDGRLYHPVVAEKVNNAWFSKHRHAHEKLGERIRKRNKTRAEKGLSPLEIPDLEQWIDMGRPLERDLFPLEFSTPSAGSKTTSTGSDDFSGGDESGIPPENTLKGNEQNGNERKGLVNPSGTAHATGTPPRASVKPADLTAAMRRHSIESQPGDPRIAAAIEAGVTVETLEAACIEGKAKKQKLGQFANAGYVLSIAEGWTRDAASPRPASPSRTSHAQSRDESRSRAAYELTTVTVTATPDQQHAEVIDVDARRIG
ncbi:Protein of unknown function [Burkholderia sp. CF099]|nr:Protein of unknown function [Burkholderia sp. CF099]